MVFIHEFWPQLERVFHGDGGFFDFSRVFAKKIRFKNGQTDRELLHLFTAPVLNIESVLKNTFLFSSIKWYLKF